MKAANTDKAWDLLVSRKAERKECRRAFLSALILSRTARADAYHPAPTINAMTPLMAEAFAVEFVRLAERIKAHAENECNREVSAAETRANDRNETRFRTIAEALGFEARTGGDPRGACAYLIDPDDRRGGDGWGEGWAVYS